MKKIFKFQLDHAVVWPIFFCFAGIYLEASFHLCVFGPGAGGFLFSCLCGYLFGCILACLHRFLPRIAGGLISGFLLFGATLFGCIQLVYYKVFGSLMQLSLIRMGGDVLNHFASLILQTILRNWLQIVLLILPVIVMIVLLILTRNSDIKTNKKQTLCLLCSVLIAVIACIASGFWAKSGTNSAFAVLRSNTTSTEYAYERLGLSGGTLRDLTSGLFTVENETYTAGIESGSPSDDTSYNALDIDFHALSASTDDDALKALDSYFESVVPTEKNEYTGFLSGYNLITICAESFSPYLISEELTPTLYKLSQSGILFENFYNTFQSLTSNGEYTMCTGLYPNMYNTSEATSFEDSISNYLPYTLGNSLSALGYSSYAYHNNVGEFYSRNLTHANMGYTFKAAGSGLDIHLTNPSSDYELFEQSADDLTGSDSLFHAHYMSWSGHNPYNWTNVMSEKNRAAVESLPYSDAVKAYLACNLELEYGLTYLMNELEQAGLADNTVIVLTTDHFPYGLTEDEYNELAGFEVDTTFEKYHSSLICYVPGLEEPIRVEEYCSTADILPTLLNLFGVEYDSRLLAGRDVFSDGIHIAVLANQSFLTEEIQFDAASGLIADDTIKDSNGYTQADYQRYVNNLFSVSRDVLDHDYYAHVFSKESDIDSSVLVNYSDITNVFHKSAVQYVTTSGLMDADSDELFGGDREATVGELLTCLSRISGISCQTNEEAVSWALKTGIVTEEDGFSAESGIDHLTCAVIMARYAVHYGAAINIDDQELAAAQSLYPELTPEQLEASLWATVETVINKSMDHVYESRDVLLNRFQLAAYISYLCTRSLGL